VVSNIFYFHPYLGKIPILTNIFQMGWNHQLGTLRGTPVHVVPWSFLDIWGPRITHVSLRFRSLLPERLGFFVRLTGSTWGMLRDSRAFCCLKKTRNICWSFLDDCYVQDLMFSECGKKTTCFYKISNDINKGKEVCTIQFHRTWATKKPWLFRVYRYRGVC